MKILKVAVVLYGLFLVGCASNPMSVSSDVAAKRPASDQAQILFMRDSFVGSAVSASIYDVSGNEPVFIGILNNGTKVAYNTLPGKHTFMVVSEAADFMEADLSAGKTYYSIVTPRTGAWKARFSMWPIKRSGSKYRLDSNDFQAWTQNTKLAGMTPKAHAWYGANRDSVISKQQKYWRVWQRKSQADLQLRTLHPQDGL